MFFQEAPQEIENKEALILGEEHNDENSEEKKDAEKTDCEEGDTTQRTDMDVSYILSQMFLKISQLLLVEKLSIQDKKLEHTFCKFSSILSL